MKVMQAMGKEWEAWRKTLEQGEASPELVMVEGPSEAVAQQAQSLLLGATLKSEPFQYYLVSGNEHFRVPCYLLFADGETIAGPIHHSHLLREGLSTRGPLYRAVNKLEQKVEDCQGRLRFVVVEYLTPPDQHDWIFASQLLRSPFMRSIPLLLFVHSNHQSSSAPVSESVIDEAFLLLYVCGGRMRAEDWTRLTGLSAAHCLRTSLVASRRIGSETWICYAHRGVAERARDHYQSLEQEQRTQLARRVVCALPNNTGYPLLAIASETEDLEAIQLKYSPATLNAALTEPESVVRYFDALHRLTRQAEADSLAGVVLICSLVAPVYRDKFQALKVCQKAQTVDFADIEQGLVAAFWLFLGHALAVLNMPEGWEYAEDCLERSRAIVDQLYQSGKIKKTAWRFYRASAAKIEALVAYKTRQSERTRRLMEFAIAELGQIAGSLSYTINSSLVDANINFGDFFFRLTRETSLAIVQYSEALKIVLGLPGELRSRLDRNRLRAAQKLGNALVKVEHYEEALQIFEMLPGSPIANVSATNDKDAPEWLKAKLALAEIYLKVKRPRSAAVCYWHILRQPDWFDLEEVQKTAARLRRLRPCLHQRLHRRIEAILVIQENRAADMLTIQHLLSHL